LADQAEQEAASQVDDQGADREGACRADLYDALEAVTRQRANGAKNRDQRKTQCRSNPSLAPAGAPMARGSPNKKLLAPLGCQESSAPGNITGTVMANSIATRKSLQSSIFPHCWKANSMP